MATQMHTNTANLHKEWFELRRVIQIADQADTRLCESVIN